MIIVTGATGKLGRVTVERLLELVPAEQIGVSVRDPQKAQDLAALGVRVRQGDFSDSATLAHAFEGATQVLIVSVNDIREAALRQHRTAIEAAKAAGAERILYTSHMGASPTSFFAPMPDHAATEAALQASGVPFTSLRNGFYADTIIRLLGDALKTGVLAAPEDGPVAWTSHPDLAEATAVILSGKSFDGPTPNLTAAAALDLEAIAALASELAGRPIRRVVVPEADYRDDMIAHGVPAQAADMLVGLFRAARQGDFAQTAPTLTNLIGHPPISVEDILKEAISTQS